MCICIIASTAAREDGGGVPQITSNMYLVLIPEIPPPFLLSEFTRCICIKTTKRDQLMQSYQIRLCTWNQDHCHVSEGETDTNTKVRLVRSKKIRFNTKLLFCHKKFSYVLSSTLPKHSIVLYFLTRALFPIKEAKK